MFSKQTECVFNTNTIPWSVQQHYLNVKCPNMVCTLSLSTFATKTMIQKILQFKARMEEGQWRCCKLPGGKAMGCVTRQQHVRDKFYLDNSQMMPTVDEDCPGKVYALDCKTCTTARGK